MGSILLLPFLATIMIFSSTGANDDDTGSVFLAQVSNSFIRNETGKNVEAIFSLSQPSYGSASRGDNDAKSYQISTDIRKIIRKLKSGNQGSAPGERHRILEPVAMMMLGAGMIGLANLRRKQTKSYSKKLSSKNP
jgi:hypothetical protein